MRQPAGAVHEPDALAVDHGLPAVDPPHPPRCTSTNVTCAGGSKSNRPVGRWPNGPPPTVRVMPHDRPSVAAQARPALCSCAYTARAVRAGSPARPRAPPGSRPGTIGRAEVPQDRAPSRGPDPLEVVEDRLEGPGVAPPAMEAEREAMGLVPSTLKKLQARVVPFEPTGAERPGTNTSSSRFASATTATRGRSYVRGSPRARPRAAPCRRRSRRGSGSTRSSRRRSGDARRGAARTFARRPGPSPRSRPGPRGRGRRRCGSASASAPRPRTPPSRRRSPCPGCSRRRSTRSAAAGSRGSASRAAARAPRRAAGVAARAPTVVLQRELRILRRELGEPALFAALRRAHLDRRRADRRGTRRALPCPRCPTGRSPAAAPRARP